MFVTRGQGGAAWTEDKPDGSSESFGICCEGSQAKIRFERRTTEETVLMQFLGNNEFVLTRMPNDRETIPLHFVQPESGNLKLTIGAGSTARTYTAPTLWHLLLTERDVCRRELLPLLQLLRENWNLDEQCEQLAERLKTFEQLAPPPSWEKMIADLGDQRFQTRQSAERRLREMGQGVLPLLESIDHRPLNAEQRLRLRAICKSLSESHEDVPQRSVAWIVNDKRLWNALARSTDDNWQSLAEKHLARLETGVAVPAQQGKLVSTEGDGR